MKFVPLTNGDSTRTPESAAEDAKLRHDGWHPQLKERKAAAKSETPKPSAPKSA